MTLQPGVRKDDEFDAHQSHGAVRWLVDQGLRVRGVNLACAEQCAVDVGRAHGTVVLTGNAAEERRVAGRGGGIDVDVLLRGGANAWNEIG